MIAILLSTYNGDKFLDCQIESIVNQTYQEWELYIRDDGSTDESIKIVNSWQRIDHRIHLMDDEIFHRGVTDSFMYMLENIQASYYMFCDQDDYWFPDKIEQSMILIHEKELEYSNDFPILVCTDLTVVDLYLNTIHKSMWKAGHVEHIALMPEFIQIASMYPGCTMSFNKKVRNIALSTKVMNGVLHDQHIALSTYHIARKIFILQKYSIKYRQHTNNVVGVYCGKHIILHKLKHICGVLKNNYNYFRIVHRYIGTSIFVFLRLKYLHLKVYQLKK